MSEPLYGEEFLGEPFGLLGCHGDDGAVVGQRADAAGDPGVGPAARHAGGDVACAVGGDDVLHVGSRYPGQRGQRFDEGWPDHGLKGVVVRNREPVAAQCGADALGDSSRGVDERAVEVEEDQRMHRSHRASLP